MDNEMIQHEEPEEFDEDVDEEEEFDDIYRGIIRGFGGIPMSGLGTLAIENENGMMEYINCDNGQTVRSLENAFGNVIGDSYDVKEDGGHIGQDIYYHVDFLGCLEWFISVKKAPKDFVEEYERKNGDSGTPNFAM